jgi:hypothetical protein
MERIALRYWNRRWQDVWFTPSNGQCHVRWFRVLDGNDVLLEVSYEDSKIRFVNRSDVALDAADEENHDFFLWFSRVAADPVSTRSVLASLVTG